jgi:hypothetical protein
MKERWVDYLAPQLYWPTTRTAQAFDVLVAWWATLPQPGQSIFVGHDATTIGNADWPLSEYDAEMKLVAAQRPNRVLGSIFFTAKPLVTDELGLRTTLAKNYWARPAATPPLAVAPDLAGALEPKVTENARKVTVAPPDGIRARAVAVYGADGTIARLVPAAVRDGSGPTTIDLEPGRWVLSVIDCFGRESVGLVTDVR